MTNSKRDVSLTCVKRLFHPIAVVDVNVDVKDSKTQAKFNFKSISTVFKKSIS